MRLAFRAVATLYVACFLLVGQSSADGRSTALRLTEMELRKHAVSLVVPTFPVEGNFDEPQGVSVAVILVSFDGSVVNARVLHAPSPAVARAMKDALSQWRFNFADVPDRSTSAYLTGKITYYFIAHNGRNRVLEPSQCPYIGPRPRVLGPMAQTIR